MKNFYPDGGTDSTPPRPFHPRPESYEHTIYRLRKQIVDLEERNRELVQLLETREAPNAKSGASGH